MPEGWLKNYLSTIQTPNTFENRIVNAILRILKMKYIFTIKSAEKKEYSPSTGKTIMLSKPKSDTCIGHLRLNGKLSLDERLHSDIINSPKYAIPPNASHL